MNIEQAKAVPILHLLDKIGLKPEKIKGHDAWFFSPFRTEKTASFKVQTSKNVWYDFGEGKGGDSINLVVEYLSANNRSSQIADALHWIATTSSNIPHFPIRQRERTQQTKPTALSVKKLSPIRHRLLIRYLETRGISLGTAQQYLQEALIHNSETGKNFLALALGNEDEGVELRNPFFKGSIGPKTITFIRGDIPKPGGFHIFEGFMDFLSVLEARSMKSLPEDSIVLNSTSLVPAALPYIAGYGYSIAYTWLDNDAAGGKAQTQLSEFFKTQENLRHRPMNQIYKSHNDVNAWHMSVIKLTP